MSEHPYTVNVTVLLDGLCLSIPILSTGWGLHDAMHSLLAQSYVIHPSLCKMCELLFPLLASLSGATGKCG